MHKKMLCNHSFDCKYNKSYNVMYADSKVSLEMLLQFITEHERVPPMEPYKTKYTIILLPSKR